MTAPSIFSSRKFLGFRFDHQHRILGAGDDEIEIGGLHLLDRRIEHIFAIDKADARRRRSGP